MNMSLQKKVVVVGLCLIGMHGVQAEEYKMTNHFKRIGAKQLTVNNFFTKFVVHPWASQVVCDTLPDALLFEKGSMQLHLHELWELLTVIAVETVNAKLYDSSQADIKDMAMLLALGTALHKLLAECANLLDVPSYFDEKIKKAYKKYGRGYVQAMLAGIVDEYFNPGKYKELAKQAA